MEHSNSILTAAVFFLITTSLLPSMIHPSPANEPSFRLDLSHVDAGRNFTVREFLIRAAARSKVRLTQLAHRHGKNYVAPIYWGPVGYEGEYLFEVGVGTPPRYLSFILDTGSTPVWTQCKPCHKCEKQPVPLYDPIKSSTFSKLSCSSKQCAALGSNYGTNCSAIRDCHFVYGYVDGSQTTGYIGSETLSFRYMLTDQLISVPSFSLGCARINAGSMTNSTGTAGFGRSPESLISQLGITRFSYCFIPYMPPNTKRSPLFLGSAAVPRGPVRSIPLIKDDVYKVSLEGITVGSTLFTIEQPTSANGGLTLFDSGTFNTVLTAKLFSAVKKAFVSKIKLPVSNYTLSVDFNLCFDTPRRGFSPESLNIPILVFHFKGADLNLPRENYIVYDAKTHLLCVMIEDATTFQEDLNIIGNFYQQNMHIFYDLKEERLSFAPAQCDRL